LSATISIPLKKSPGSVTFLECIKYLLRKQTSDKGKEFLGVSLLHLEAKREEVVEM